MAHIKPLCDTAELRRAAEVQKSLIPRPVSRDDIEVDIRYHPAAMLSGDYAALWWAGRKQLYLTMCDVMGHGIAAALFASRVNGEVRCLAQGAPEPGELLIRLNQFIHQNFSQTKMFATFICILLDLENKTLVHAAAGHPPALIVSADGRRAQWIESQCTVIGPFDNCCQMDDPQERMSVESGDVLVMYTDGLTETVNDRRVQFGKERLREAVLAVRAEPAIEIANALLDQVNTWRSGKVQDDILLSVAKVK